MIEDVVLLFFVPSIFAVCRSISHVGARFNPENRSKVTRLARFHHSVIVGETSSPGNRVLVTR